MTLRPALSVLRLPRVSAARVDPGSFNDAMQRIEAALTQSVKAGTTPSLPGLILTAADGSSWRLAVAPDGTLSTAPVPRS